MLLDIGTEEIAHVEMLATMIAGLLEQLAVEAAGGRGRRTADRRGHGRQQPEDIIMAGMNPQHLIVSGRAPRRTTASASLDVALHHRQRQPAGRLPL